MVSKIIVTQLLCLLVLASGMQLGMHQHFCGPFLKDVSLLLPAGGCGMDTTERAATCSAFSKKCCSDKTTVLKKASDLQQVLTQDVGQPYQAVLFQASTLWQPLVQRTLHHGTYKTYRPPIITNDLSIQYACFII